MKLLAVFLLVAGLALASAVPVQSEEISINSLEELDSLLITLSSEGDDSDLEKRLKESFEEIVSKIKDALGNNKSFRDGLERLKEIRQKLRDLRTEFGEKGKDLMKKLREKVKEYLQKLLNKFNDKRSIEMRAEWRERLREIRDFIRDHMDANKEVIEAKIREIYGEGSDVRNDFSNKLSLSMAEKFIEKLRAKKQFLLDFLNRILFEKKEDRSIKDVYEKVKDYFKELQIELKEKFVKFGEWAKEKYEEGLEKGKSRVDNLKKLARKFIDDAKVKSKEVAEQAKEFFREYKEDLGKIYNEVREKVREIVNKN